jgi:hypothetical protein
LNESAYECRQFPELLQIIAAIDDARIDERRGFDWHFCGLHYQFIHRRQGRLAVLHGRHRVLDVA